MEHARQSVYDTVGQIEAWAQSKTGSLGDEYRLEVDIVSLLCRGMTIMVQVEEEQWKADGVGITFARNLTGIVHRQGIRQVYSLGTQESIRRTSRFGICARKSRL